MLCGRYEGVDERVRAHLTDGEISIGDVVLAGGEVAAMVVLEAVGRLVPGVMGNDTSADDESFGDGLLEYPHYTKPAEFRGWSVPEILRSGDHGRVERWRRAQALRRTLAQRPDLIARRGGLTEDEQRLLAEWDDSPLVVTGGLLCRFRPRAPILTCSPERQLLPAAPSCCRRVHTREREHHERH